VSTLRKRAEEAADKVYDEMTEIWGASEDGIASNKTDIADAIEREAKAFAERALRAYTKRQVFIGDERTYRIAAAIAAAAGDE
jgi:ElaB/YqjD/DUF883 family membrane-anchored ribosome-binding protein